MRALLLLAFLPVAVFAQPGAVPSIETDQVEYAYGETIEVRYTITNESGQAFELNSPSGSCTAGLTFGSLSSPGEFGACSLDDIYLEFAPGASRTWVWQLIPNEHAVPEESGAQIISAYFGSSDWSVLEAQTEITAPRYLGGRIWLRLAGGVTLDDVQDVMEALDAEVIDAGSLHYVWEIEGITVFDAVAAYQNDNRFSSFEVFRILDYADIIYTTDAEATLDGASLLLTAARPNPFASSTSFSLTVPKTGATTVEVFDVLGRRVATLHDGPLAPNVEHHFTFAANALPSGLYVVRATGDGYAQTRRVTLSR